jgi:hypothetical protein
MDSSSTVFHDSDRNFNYTNISEPHPVVKKASNIEFDCEQEKYYNEDVKKLGILMDELSNAISNEPQDKQKAISEMMLVCALSCQNPVESYKENLSFCKNKMYLNKITQCISSSCNLPIPLASVFVKKSILRERKDNELTEKTNIQKQHPPPPPSFTEFIKRSMA